MNQVALITGSSRGIGAATALRLAEDGYDICVNYLNDSASAKQIASAAKKFGVKAITVQADVSKTQDIERLFASVDEQFGRLDALINNAGILFQQGPLSEINKQRIEAVFATNVIGTMLCSKEAIARMSTMKGGQGGVIVNVSSVAAKTGSPNEYIDYAASKGAVDTFTIGLAAEVAEQGIRVNAVRAGFIYTQMHASGGEANRVDRVKSFVPMQRGGKPEEVAAAIAWLLSDESSYTTGSFIDVGGGR